MTAPLLAVAAALVPLALLAVLVLRVRAPVGVSAWSTAACAAVVALWPFRLDGAELAAGAFKGLWTGAWIVLVVVPALLLYDVAEQSGALDRLSSELDALAPTPGRRLLLLAWAFPAFLQGATGFGSPLAVAAPMLARSGLSPVEALAACLVGYHWSVAFGSMGSGFFIAVGTARLDAGEAVELALRAAALLVVNAAASAALLLRRAPRGSRAEALPAAIAMGAAMTVVLVATAAVQPALASILAGLAGLTVAMWALPARDAAPDRRVVLTAFAPYLLLAALVGVAFGVGPVRAALTSLPQLAPSFGESRAAYGHVTPAVAEHTPFRPLLHPMPYILAATAAAAWLYRRAGWWRAGAGRAALRAWSARIRPTAVSILGLTTLAGIMVEAGMIAALASALAATLGLAYAAAAPAVGTVGTVLTGSTSASNALLAPLQAEAAVRLGLDPPVLVAAQTAGGNVGNILAPVTILVGAIAVGCAGREGEVIRRNLVDAALLLALVTAGVLLQALALPGALR